MKTKMWIAGILLGSLLSTHAAKPPNVIFIICDDLNDTVAGMGGHPQAFTPNIDRLCQRGVRFANGHCNAPICGPSRASLWSGLYPSVTGYYGYNQQANHWRRFPALAKAVTLMEHFKSNGYNVYGSGKVFHNGHEDNAVFTVDPGRDGAGPVSFGPQPWDGVAMQFGKPVGSGHPSLPPDLRSSYWSGFGSLSDVPTVGDFTGWSRSWGGAPWKFRYESDSDRDLMPDELTAQWATAKLKAKHAKPFLMICGMNRPHTPRYVPQEFFDRVPAVEDIQLPPYRTNDLADCAGVLCRDPKTGRLTYPASELDRYLASGDKTAEGGLYWWKKWVQSYLACVAFVDQQIGTILDGLEQSDYAANTIVILTSDHGYHMGEKNHMAKTTIWEEATRVPYVVYAPGLSKAGGICEQPVSLVDFYPTLIDLCGLPKDPNAKGNGLALSGHSLRPLLVDPAKGAWDGPAVALNHLHGPKAVARNTPSPVSQNHHSVRSRRYRYTLCSTGEEELYDHERDPNEWTNLASDTGYSAIKAELRSKLEAMVGLPATKSSKK